jgi:hypothetical protein
MKRIMVFVIAAIFAMTTGSLVFAGEAAAPAAPPAGGAAAPPPPAGDAEKKPAKKKAAKKRAAKKGAAKKAKKGDGEAKGAAPATPPAPTKQ